MMELSVQAEETAAEPSASTPSKGSFQRRHILVTGGASFIGSALVDALVERGAKVRVVDNLSSGKYSHIRNHVESGAVDFLQMDLLEEGAARRALKGIELVFHLAADHGGRGYLERHQAACATNLVLDGLVFRAALLEGVEKVIYASSGCVYPNYLQTDPRREVRLREDMVGPPYEADELYGWAKLVGEMTLRAYSRERGLKSACCRYFTVYGERADEGHALMAMIARAFVQQDPFVVWGNGAQVRNWTYVGDIVSGTLRAAERIEDGTAVNLGTREATCVLEAAESVLRYTGHQVGIELHPEMPTGPMNRVADNSLARHLLGWEPKVKFIEGLHRTIDWYYATKKRDEVMAILEHALWERIPQTPTPPEAYPRRHPLPRWRPSAATDCLRPEP